MAINPVGFKFAAVSAEVKKAGFQRLDYAFIMSETPCVVAGTTTTNRVFAAPVEITRERLKTGFCQGVLVNSGNANAYTGSEGLADAERLVKEAAANAVIDPGLIIPMSTGVIGSRLPLDRMLPKTESLVGRLGKDGFSDVARAILTTDTREKVICLESNLSAGTLQIVGMAKGSGMIAPNMATMLAILLINVSVDRDFLQESLTDSVDGSFNSITVDGDTSTNDTVLALAGPKPGLSCLNTTDDKRVFRSTLESACKSLARQIVLDGEGASKLIHVKVTGALSRDDASKVAAKISNSPLVKTAFHGEDPNWGRIVCSAGMAGVEFDPAALSLWIGDILIVRHGQVMDNDWETSAHAEMSKTEFTVRLDLGMGDKDSEFLTTDLSEEYIGINADYRS